MKATFLMDLRMVKEFTITLMDLFMKEIGKKDSSMVKENFLYPITVITLEISNQDFSTVKENINLQTERCTRESGKMI